jgi:hypothetical protein
MTRERYCRECGTVFDAVNDADRLCKKCTLKNLKPGPTTADATGSKRLRKLEDRRLVICEGIPEELDRLSCIEHEIRQLKEGNSG